MTEPIKNIGQLIFDKSIYNEDSILVNYNTFNLSGIISDPLLDLFDSSSTLPTNTMPVVKYGICDDQQPSKTIGELIYNKSVYTNSDTILVTYKGFSLSGLINDPILCVIEPINVTPSNTPTRTSTITPTISITPSFTPTKTITPTITSTITVTPTITPSISPTPTVTPTNTNTPSITPTNTATPTITPSITLSPTNTNTPTLSVTPTKTLTPTTTPTPTITVTPTITSTTTPTVTPTPSKAFTNAFMALGTSTNVAKSVDNGSSWTASNSLVSRQWSDIAYGNNKFIACASQTNQIAVFNGTSWSEQTIPSTQLWSKILYGNNTFLIINNSNTTSVISTDSGSTWSTSSTPNNGWTAGTYGNGLFVIVKGSTTNLYSSSNGSSWTSRSLPSTSSWASIVYGSDGTSQAFIAIADNSSSVAVSTNNLVTWTIIDMGQLDYWRSIAYGNGRFVVITGDYGGRTSVSTDFGTTWSHATNRLDQNQVYYKIVFANGYFVAVGELGRSEYSTDGINWTKVIIPGGYNYISMDAGQMPI